MNTFKKILTTTLTAGMIFSAQPVDFPETSIVFSQNQAYAEELPKEEIIKKISDANANYKSAETTGHMTITEGSQQMKIQIDTSFILDPLVSKTKMTVGNETIEVYFKDDYVYISSPDGSGTWVKTNNPEMINTFRENIKLATSPSTEYLNLLQKIHDKTNVTEKDGKYLLSYSGSGEELDAIVKLFDAIGAGNPVAKDTKIKKADISYTVDKDTLKIDRLVGDITMSSPTFSQDVVVKQDFKFSNIDAVSEIPLPEAAKNAIDAEKLKQ